MKKDAKTLLTKVAEHPEVDELFHRAPPLSTIEFKAMVAKFREERASWGGKNGS